MPTSGSRRLHYEIGDQLGAGGMGEVYRARDTRLGRDVALKFIAPQYRGDTDRRARLLQEARAASVLRSPAIAVTYDIAEDGDDLFIVMELVEGEPLSERLARGPLAVPVVLDLARQVAEALDEAHGRGIIHRDIKSANLLISDRGQVKILDFGLAKLTGPAHTDQATMAETQVGMVVGTVSYMAPEQALGKPVDPRSDLFSLGVVLYESLTATLPFAGETLAAVVDKILRHDPPLVGRLNHDVSAPLEALVGKLLAKDPAKRYQNARELVADLDALQSSGDSSRDRPTSPTNSVAVMPFANITREPGDDWIGSGIAETVTSDLKNINGLTVIGRERVFDTLRNLGSSDAGGLDVRLSIDVGRLLSASWLVSGGYQRLGDTIRITARVVEVASGTVGRTVKIDGAIGDIFSLQDKIVRELTEGMNLTLHDSEVAEIERDETQSVDAYEARSRAMMNILEGSPQALDQAIHLLEKATTDDPNYAAAWAALGMAYDLKGSALTLPELSRKAVEVERRALAINPNLADAYRWLGFSLLTLGQYDEAIDAMREAARLEPGDANVYTALGRAYWVGKGQLDQGIAFLEHSLVINPDLGWAHLQLGLLYALRGDYLKAETAARRAAEMQERFVSGREGLQILGAYTRLGYVFYLQQRYDEALRAYERELTNISVSNHALKERSLIDLNYKLGATYLRMDRVDEANHYFDWAWNAFKNRVARGADDPATKYYVAALCALRGEKERAIRYLAETLEYLPALNRTRARIDPDFDGLRGEPAFQALLDERADPEGTATTIDSPTASQPGVVSSTQEG